MTDIAIRVENLGKRYDVRVDLLPRIPRINTKKKSVEFVAKEGLDSCDSKRREATRG